MIVLRNCALAIALVSTVGAAPRDAMPGIAHYLLPPQTEIALAQSAAPASISRSATVMVLGAGGYRIARRGDNGFTCIVERGWMQPFSARNFWSGAFRAPTCYNAGAARTVLPYTIARTKLALDGYGVSQIRERIVAQIAASALPTPAPGSMAYMMSKSQYLNDRATSWYPHVMMFAPAADGADGGRSWGANRDLSPVAFDAAHVMPEPWACFYVPVGHWSDGTPAPAYTGM